MATSTIIAIVIAVLAAAAAVAQSLGKAKAARMLHAVVAGVEAAGASFSNEDDKKIKSAIAGEATKLGINSALHAVVTKLTK
jgi:hypothetical protein